MAAAIAEQPRAKVECFRIANRKAQGAPAAFQRLLMPSAVEQCLGNPAVQLGVCLAISVALARIAKTNVQGPGIYCGGKVFGVDCERGGSRDRYSIITCVC